MVANCAAVELEILVLFWLTWLDMFKLDELPLSPFHPPSANAFESVTHPNSIKCVMLFDELILPAHYTSSGREECVIAQVDTVKVVQ